MVTGVISIQTLWIGVILYCACNHTDLAPDMHAMLHNCDGLFVQDFKDKNGHFDISKILHIYNWVTYDLLHNR